MRCASVRTTLMLETLSLGSTVPWGIAAGDIARAWEESKPNEGAGWIASCGGGAEKGGGGASGCAEKGGGGAGGGASCGGGAESCGGGGCARDPRSEEGPGGMRRGASEGSGPLAAKAWFGAG